VAVVVRNFFYCHNFSLVLCAKYISPLLYNHICQPERSYEYHYPTGKPQMLTLKEKTSMQTERKNTNIDPKEKHKHRPKGKTIHPKKNRKPKGKK
jgi:hypothetical protein